MKMYLLIFLSFLTTLTPVMAQEEFPGNATRIAYETGMLELLRENQKEARLQLEIAMNGGGPYGDLSRIMIVRLQAQSIEVPTAQPDQVLRGLLIGFEDQKLLPLAWYAMIQALLESGRNEEALRQSLEFSLRFNEHKLLDDALLIAAKILYQKKDFEAALDLISRIQALGPKLVDRLAETRLLKSQIYLSSWQNRSLLRACSALQAITTNNLAIQLEANKLLNIHCK